MLPIITAYPSVVSSEWNIIRIFSAHGTGQKMLDIALQYRVGFEANGVAITFFLQQAVQRRIDKE